MAEMADQKRFVNVLFWIAVICTLVLAGLVITQLIRLNVDDTQPTWTDDVSIAAYVFGGLAIVAWWVAIVGKKRFDDNFGRRRIPSDSSRASQRSSTDGRMGALTNDTQRWHASHDDRHQGRMSAGTTALRDGQTSTSTGLGAISGDTSASNSSSDPQQRYASHDDRRRDRMSADATVSTTPSHDGQTSTHTGLGAISEDTSASNSSPAGNLRESGKMHRLSRAMSSPVAHAFLKKLKETAGDPKVQSALWDIARSNDELKPYVEVLEDILRGKRG